MNENLKYQYEGMKWLKEMELVEHPQFINTLKMNVLSVSKSIKDVEFLISRHQMAILVWVDLSWFGKRFRTKQILMDVEDQLKLLVPSFTLRVVSDRSILEASLAKLEELKEFKRKLELGGKNEKRTPANPNVSITTDGERSETELQKESNSVSDSQEQSQSEELAEAVESDS